MNRKCGAAVWLIAAFLFSTDSAQAQPTPEQIAHMRFIGSVRASVGNSGLRRFLSETASLGELRNRASAYRIIEQIEGARTASLEGRIAGLENALSNPTLPAPDRAQLQTQIEAARAELVAIPTYRAHYVTSTVQAGALADIAALGEGALFALVRGAFTWRSDSEDYLSVQTGRIDVAPVYFPSSAWFLSFGFTGTTTDVDVLAFDGSSNTTALGLRFDAGGVLSPHWALGVHASRLWTEGTTEVVRRSPDPTTVRSEPSSDVWSGKLELMGRFGSDAWPWLPDVLEVRPLVGAYLLQTGYDPVLDSTGELSTGPFGDSDALTLVAAGLGLAADAGHFAPSLYLGVDHELASALSDVVADRLGIVLAGEIQYAITPSRRVGVSCRLGRSTGGHRRSTEIDLVGIIDF